MTDFNLFEFSTTFLKTLVDTYNKAFTWLSQPFVDFLENSPIEIPQAVIAYLNGVFGETSILMMMFGTALYGLVVITMLKWVIGIVK